MILRVAQLMCCHCCAACGCKQTWDGAVLTLGAMAHR
jgi:hypothetical protein